MKAKKHIFWRVLWFLFLAWIFVSAAVITIKLLINLIAVAPGEAYISTPAGTTTYKNTATTSQFIGALAAFLGIGFITIILFFPLRKAFKNLY
jgi:hypothetical protein